MTQVLLVEDSRIAREALSGLLTRSGRYQIYAAIENAANAEIVCMGGAVSLVLMDICTACDESGLLAAAEIKRHYPEIRVILMTSMPEYSFLEKAERSGADGFWYKEFSSEDPISVCDRVMAGEPVWPGQCPKIRIGNAWSTDFTDREMEVLRALSQGCKYGEIADHLCISENTLKYHIRNLLQKTGFRSTLQLVVEAVDQKLILPKY